MNSKKTISQRRWLQGVGLLSITAALLLIPADAYADLSAVEGRLTSIFDDLNSITKKIAWGIFGVGAIVIGVKLNNGDPDTRHRLWQFIFGGLIVMFAGDIIAWLSGGAR